MESSWAGLRFPRPRLAPEVAWRTVIRVSVDSRGCFRGTCVFFRHYHATTCPGAPLQPYSTTLSGLLPNPLLRGCRDELSERNRSLLLAASISVPARR